MYNKPSAHCGASASVEHLTLAKDADSGGEDAGPRWPGVVRIASGSARVWVGVACTVVCECTVVCTVGE